MSTLVSVLIFAAPGVVMTWACVDSLRSGRFPVFWFAVTVVRGGHPRLHWTLWVLMFIATGVVDYVSAATVMMQVTARR
jgi:hypothetical protein